ncbi:DNA polymerase III subunit alpha [Cephaloticoccus primus]|uniref:DNA polymerase III subunit alpha n=1 Tax=Cephaloticoccus primus TaxID=1548207 RepID=A0A139SS73_9BACT|nr:DNA polymerase III subunit alpha [Cephaloticoccus primus]KXU37364.1 DNA polymerase III subunit alpha [Cephaloticoccus primus]
MSATDQNFVHLHVHTDYSVLNGACRIDRLMKRTTELGMSALAITDRGNLFGAIAFYEAARAKGIKPLIGCDMNLVETSRLEKAGHADDAKTEGKTTFQQGLLARDLEGYHNLLKLVSDAHLRGFYYKPRTDMEILAAHARGLIGFTGGLAALIPQHLLHDREEEARRACARFVDIFGRENYFVELQDHGIPEQKKIIPGLLRLAEEFDLRVVCTNDVHYINASDASPHDTLLCIQTAAKLSDPGRFKFSTTQFYLKSRDEMARVFSEVPEALSNTQLVADMCNLEIPYPKGSERYPKYPLPPEIRSEKTPAQYLHQLCVEGLRARYQVDYEQVCTEPAAAGRLDLIHNRPEGQKPQPPDYAGLTREQELVVRLGYEQAIIEVTGFVDYFLVVWDFIYWAKQRDIPVGPGRGSGAGCLVAYLLGITNIDPIRFGLLFERFLNPERVSPPDFDIDFCMRRRSEVIDYVRDKYGRDCVANIITYGTLGAKMVVRDISRVHDLPFAEADRLAKMIPDEINIELRDALNRSAELKNEYERNPLAKKIIDQGFVLEGLVRNTGKHAAGIIITDQPLDNFVPLTLQEGDVTVQFSMKAVDKLGLLKMDFLGLKTLTVIADAVAHVRRTSQPDFDIDSIPLDDARTYELLNAGKTVGVFQLESGGMQNAARQVGISNIDDINAISALYRPGPMQFIPDYARGKKQPDTISYPHPLLEDILRETYGIIVYQEQVMQCAQLIAGYSLGEADMLRRAMGKKDAAAMAKERERFVRGAHEKHGIREAKADEIFELLNKFAQYGFNKSHSAAYALVAYQTAYLKANYPVEFMAAVLTAELGNADKVAHFIAECEAMGLTVLGPHINESRESFTPVGAKIRFGLAGIKGVGEAASQRIIEEREQHGPYKDFDDFIARIDSRAANKRVLEHLIKTGAFDYTGAPRQVLFEGIDAALAQAAALARDRAAGQNSFFDILAAEPPPASAARKTGGGDGSPTASAAGQTTSAGDAQNQPAAEGDFSTAQKLQFEKELLGFYVSGHPMNLYNGLAEAIDTYPVEQLLQLSERRDFRLCGIAGNIVRRLSRKDNRPWAAFTLATRHASLALNMFSEAYDRYGSHLSSETPILVQGNVMIGDEGPRLNIRECYPLDTALPAHIRAITWLLHPEHPQLPDFLQQLRATLDGQSGDTRLHLGFLFPADQASAASATATEMATATPNAPRVAALADISTALSWRLDPQAFQRLRAHPATAGVQIETKPLELKNDRRWSTRS